MGKILVIGGAGYIGSQTNLELIENGYDTIVLDSLLHGKRELVPGDFVQGDLLNIESLDSVFKTYSIDAVIHFAAYAYVGESVINPEKYYYNNVVGTLNLLQAMRKHGVDKIVFSSTCAIFGTPDIIPITEDLPKNPINPYGYTKLAIERVFDDYAHAYGLKSVALRYFNASGADLNGRTGETHNPETHLIPIILQVAMGERESLKVFGDTYDTPDGTCIRDYIHTKDLAQAHILALKKLIKAEIMSEKINLGTGTGFSVFEIIKHAELITQTSINYIIDSPRPGDPAILIADNSKAKKILNWEPQYSDLETILSSAWKWAQYQKHA